MEAGVGAGWDSFSWKECNNRFQIPPQDTTVPYLAIATAYHIHVPKTGRPNL